MIPKMIMVHFLVILHWPRKLQISQWRMQCLRMEDVIRSDHSKLWHFWTETWDYLRSRVTKSLLLNLSFFDTIDTLLLISNDHLLSPQKWSQFVHFNFPPFYWYKMTANDIRTYEMINTNAYGGNFRVDKRWMLFRS